MKDETRRALASRETWLRGLSYLLFYLLLLLAVPVLMLASLAGWLMRLVQGEESAALRDFGRQGADWLAQCMRYITGNAERRPFPFEDLDCPRDQPAAGYRSQTGKPAAPARPAVPVPAAEGEVRSKSAVPRASAVAGDLPERNPAGKKKAGKKKADKKPGAKKKIGKKKVVRKNVDAKSASESESPDPVATKKKSLVRKTAKKTRTKPVPDSGGPEVSES